MARPRRIDPTVVARAEKVVATATDVQQLRAAQAVLLPAVFRASLEQTAAVLGVGRATVSRLQTRFRAQATVQSQPHSSWGGRRRALLSEAEEAAFLSRWQSQAEAGELIVLSTMRSELEKQLGRKVAPEVFYRLVRRHRWRKVAPDTRHPKSDPSTQEEWKKKRFHRSWRPL
jgi:transposase